MILSLASISAIGGILWFARSITNSIWGVFLGILLGGVAGNLSDRIFRPPYWFGGEVVDWIKLPHWPIFNLADSSILLSAGAIGLLIIKNIKPRVMNDE